MQIIKPLHNSNELKRYKSIEVEKLKQVKNDKYHVVYNLLLIVFILPYIKVLTITLIPFRTYILNQIIMMIESKIQDNNTSTNVILALLGLMLFTVMLGAYFVIMFKITYCPIKLLKKYWIKRKLWRVTNETVLDQLNKCISTLLWVEEITKLPQHVLDETDVYKEPDKLIFKIKEEGYIIEKTLILDKKMNDVCKPGCIDFSSLDVEIDILIEIIKNFSVINNEN